MKPISTALKNHLASTVTTLATCWKLIRRDGTVMGFTDHDKDLMVDAVSYAAATGFTPTAILSSVELSVSNMEVEGALSSAAITEADLLAGRYDNATIEVFLVNYQDPDSGTLALRRGWIGEVRTENARFFAEIRGLAQALQQPIGRVYAAACDARFCDARCGLNAGDFTVTGSVTQVVDRANLVDSALPQDDDYFTYGLITWLTGANQGLSMEVKSHTAGGEIALFLPMPYDIEAGDTFSVIAGCDKRLNTCKNTYNNVVNFRGHPHIPGIDQGQAYPNMGRA